MFKAITTFGGAVKDAGQALARRKQAKKLAKAKAKAKIIETRPDYEASVAGYLDALILPQGSLVLRVKKRRLN